MMNIQDIYEYLAQNQPKVIHISGKTSTGKSTFAKRLRDLFGYEIVELDQIVINKVVKHNGSVDEGLVFAEVYKNRNHLNWIRQFSSSTKEKIAELHSTGINTIIDGAVANPQTLKEILDGSDAVIIYLHPESLENYIRNLTSRFLTVIHQDNAGLPSKFWDKIPSANLASFLENKELRPAIKKAIKVYAKESQAKSAERLETFQDNFDNVLLVTI